MKRTDYDSYVSWWRWTYLDIMWPFWRLRSRIRYRLTGGCGFSCGMVIEAGCPIHDE